MTLLRHVTAGERIRELLDEREARGEEPYNITQLAKVMEKARESVSRRVNGQISVTGEYPDLFAKALGISPDELRPPAVEVVSLSSLDRRLKGLADLVADLNRLNREALAALAEMPRTAASPKPRPRAGENRR